MVKIRGNKTINPEIDGYIYIYQKDFNQVKIQEAEEGSFEIDVSDIFSNATKWKWGIRTDKYWGVFLSAIAFKVPQIKLSVPNVLVAIKKQGEFVSINALVFAEKQDVAFKYANEFKKANRQTIAFELAPEYYENNLGVSIKDIIELLETVDRKLDEIKEITQEVKEDTSNISEETKIISRKLDTLIKEFNDFRSSFKDEVAKEVVKLFNNVENKVIENKIIVHRIDEEGIYSEGEKVYLKLFGSVFDYLEIEMRSLTNHFGIDRKLTEEEEKKIYQLVKEKFFNKEKYITPEDLEQIGLKVKNKDNWQIILRVKDVKMKRVVSMLSKLFKSKENNIERAFLSAITDAVTNKRELTLDIFEKYLTEEERRIFDKVKRAVSGSSKELKGDVYLKADKEIEELLLYALSLEAEKYNREVIIR